MPIDKSAHSIIPNGDGQSKYRQRVQLNTERRGAPRLTLLVENVVVQRKIYCWTRITEAIYTTRRPCWLEINLVLRTDNAGINSDGAVWLLACTSLISQQKLIWMTTTHHVKRIIILSQKSLSICCQEVEATDKSTGSQTAVDANSLEGFTERSAQARRGCSLLSYACVLPIRTAYRWSPFLNVLWSKAQAPAKWRC